MYRSIKSPIDLIFFVFILLLLQEEMQRFLGKIVNLVKEEKLFASQGGPIILAQVVYYCTSEIHDLVDSCSLYCNRLKMNMAMLNGHMGLVESCM